MAGFNECVEEIIKASGDKLSKREAAELLRKFNESTAKLPIDQRLSSIKAIADDLKENMVRKNDAFNIFAKQQELQYELTMNNVMEESKLRIQSFKPSVGQKIVGQHRVVTQVLDQMLNGTPGKKWGLRQRAEAVRHRFNVALVPTLESKGMLSHWKDTETVQDAVRIAFDPSSRALSKESQEMGAVLRDIFKLGAVRLNKAGSWATPSPNILFNTRVGDPTKVRAMGKEAFVDFVNGLNIDRNHFKGMEALEIKEYVETVYDKLVMGDQFRAPAGKFDGIGGLTKERYRNLGSSNSLDYTIPFADADSFLKFHSALSDESIQASLTKRVDAIGRAVGLMENFTGAPERFIDDWLANLEPLMTDDDKAYLLNYSKPPNEITAKGVAVGAAQLPFKALKYFSDAHPRHILAELDGSANIPGNHTVARITSGLRAWTAMTSLARGIFMQTTDLPIKVAQLIKYGKDPFEPILRSLGAFATHSFPSEEKQLFYARLGASLHSSVRELARTAEDPTSLNGFSAKVLDIGLKANGMAWFDNVQKMDTLDFLSENLAYALQNKKESMLGLFRQYDFTDADFEKLSRAIGEVEGTPVIEPQLLQPIDDALYEKYLGTLHHIKNDVTPTSGARERAALRKGTRPGTLMGELLINGTMFKSYPTMLMSRVYPQLQYEHGVGGTMATMLAMFGMYYLGDSLKQMSMGLTPKPLSKPENVIEAMIRSGMGGLYVDYLANDYRQNGMSLQEMAGGPVAGHIQDLLELGSAATRFKEDPDTGEFKSELTGKMAAQKLNRALPNVHFAKTALEHTLIYGIMEMHDPGSVQASYDRIKARTGQERLF